jgi:Rrf2 family protein
LFKKTSQYALQVVLHLAAQETPDTYVTVRRLAERCGVPYHFLGKICHRLTRAGLLHSYKGPNGGVALARPSAEVTLLEVVDATDGREAFEQCVLGLDPCHADLPCPMHAEWEGIRDRIVEMLSSRTLGELVEELARGETTLEKEIRIASGGVRPAP